MNVTMACIAGEEIYRQVEAGRFCGKSLGSQNTPFGPSTEFFLIEGDHPFYLLPRHGLGMNKTPASKINYLANFYAIKDLGAAHVLSWGPGGAVTHNMAVGDLVILDDVIDRTTQRPRTFFEDSPLGFLRQFPVFCPFLRRVAASVLANLKLLHHTTGTAAVSEGPRLETPAEVRMLASMGAQVVTHNFAPEVFLAKELELCHAAICYVVNYAETGSKHRPFAAGELFGGLTQRSDRERLNAALSNMSQVVCNLAATIATTATKDCDCARTMENNRRLYNIGDDWRAWFGSAKV